MGGGGGGKGGEDSIFVDVIAWGVDWYIRELFWDLSDLKSI